ncbi:hypothetical protein PHYSODRAFT_307004 [Phytophthora sojae]|uniref:RRM domain-containing protein n=1 Tax=Phytophthora sojae (strain P6497) TaxID=1094619 RepID=G5AC52_PHYSP|nr:hypothetical protein PHYSODRAFT_307004 [Phytophthora sojae]EGZ07175.1 hypothetical protein PHYSODRAFT_307004 [Phytophthora sojae]|eukprot:XP_009537939.1 hypothetical protein PHYSODRAFT_307004 [Phytophthora sojae]
MGDSAAALWESELLRARQWLAARRRDEQQEREQLFQRVKAHIGFKDHQRSLQSDAVASEDEDDALALDFLGDVDASDMSALLQAEAAKASAFMPHVEVGPPLKTRMPTAAELMQPLAMPSNLASPTLKPKVKAVPMSQLDPKTVRTATSTATTATTAATGSATLGSDVAVHELMQNLQVDVIQLQGSDAEETKTEESTPPHLLKEFGANSKVASGGAAHAAGSTQSKFMQQVSLKSPQDPYKKKVAAPATTTTTTMTDDVAAEMLSWVSGYRDPEVIRRKENMRRRRKHTNRYGMSSEEEQREALRRAKQITNSDSESEDDFSSDYSPAEEEEVPEPDEPEVVDLLSDDYLDSDEDTIPVKRKRKRLRQAASTQKKKKPRPRKPAVTRKLSQQDSTTKEAPLQAETPPVQTRVGSPASEAYHTVATTKSVSTEVSDKDASGNSNQPIEVSSSEDEAKDNDKSSTSTTVNGTQEKVVDVDVTKESTIVRLKIPADFQSPQTVQDASQNTQQMRTVDAEVDKVPSEAHGRAGNVAAVAPLGSALHQTTAGRQDANQPDKEEATQQPADSSDGDTDLSDTGTLDLEEEELSLGNEDSNAGEEAASLEVKTGSDAGGAREETVKSVDTVPKNADTETSAENVEMEDEDVSEAETEILEDDEPDTDDLGLEYSDDSDADDKPADSKKNGAGGETKAPSDEKDGAAPTQKTSEAGDVGDSGKSMNGKSGDEAVDSSTAGVQQFFDFTPLRLKPKAKTTTTTAPKPLPVHDYTETHAKKGSNDAKKATVEPKQTPSPDKPSLGSNGLRPSKKPIATSTVMKGKFAVTRRSTKMLDPEDTPGAKRPHKNHYTMVPTKKPNGLNAAKDLDDVPLKLLARELSKKTEEKSNARYLAYAGAKKTEDAPSYAVETTRNVPKSRFGGGSESSSTTQNSSAATNGQNSQMNDKTASRGGYRLEPQISIYDALHMDGQESASDIREGTGYKRPSRFKKMQEEAARNGTPMVKSRLQDTDLDKLPIPKKKKQPPQAEKAEQDTPPKASRANDYGSRSTPGKTQNKRRKKSFGPPSKNSGPSYYGPQASQSSMPDKYESPSRGRRGRENGSYRRDDDRRRKRSPSPPSRERDRYSRDSKLRDDRRRRGSSRSRSRSPSPRGRDYGSNRYRRRSRSRSWSRERPSEHDHRRSEQTVSSSRDRDRDPRINRRSPSSDKRDSSKKSVDKPSDPPELGEVCRNGKIDENNRLAKKQKLSPREDVPPSPGALATFDDDGDMFISDSDDDGNAFVKEVEDIRFDLDSVPVDEDLMVRQVYVTGVNPTVCAEQIEGDFARFGVAVDRDTGFPAIEVFPSQRTHLGRGDACVTFETEEGAEEAVEELNSKNVKNSMIRVRRMDVHTQRILTVQFETVRDTWKCAGTQCRADVSVWNPKCDKCGQKRVFGPSNIKIVADSWLCSICFTANDSFATSCHGCSEVLPEVDRSTFYTS